MKKYILIALLLAGYQSFNVYAKIITVSSDFSPNVAQFSEIQHAINAASNGDTIYIYPGKIPYTSATINKKVTLIGSGFNKVNDFTSLSTLSSNDTLRFEEGSEGSIIESMVGNFNIDVSANNVSINKCKIGKIIIQENTTDITVINCIIHNMNIQQDASLYIYNSLIEGYYAISADINSVLYIRNSILGGNFTNALTINAENAKSLTLINSIIIGYYIYASFESANILPTNFFFISSSRIQPNDYRWFIEMGKNFRMSEESPGKNAGSDGSDLGIYGGDFPFKDDGSPSIPTIYYLNAPTTASKSDGLRIELKAKTN